MDMDLKKGRTYSSGIFNKNVDLNNLLSLPKSFRNSESVVLNREKRCIQESPIKSYVAGGSTGTGESGLTGSPAVSPLRDSWSEKEVAHEGDEVHNICTSRWANLDNSPAELLCSNDTTSISGVIDSLEPLQNVKLTSEIRELCREGSDGNSDSSFFDDLVRNNTDLQTDDDDHKDDEGNNHADMEMDEIHCAHIGDVNVLPGCKEVSNFEKLNRIGEGTYGVVYKARNRSTGEIVALKKVKKEVEKEGFPVAFLREISLLLALHHPSIVHVKEVAMTGLDDVLMDDVFMVMEYVEHDLKGLMKKMKKPFSEKEVKCLMLQLLEGVKYLHDNWVLHRDLKTSNLLLSTNGKLKICDLGISRRYGSQLKPYTPGMVTLWYRAPELLLGAEEYSTAVDMWSVGCIMAELLTKQPLFNGDGEIDHLSKIFNILGTPNEKVWPGFSELPGVKKSKAILKQQKRSILADKFQALSFTGSTTLSGQGFNLLSQLLTYDPAKRITVEEALRHPWLCEETLEPLPGQEALALKLESIAKQ
ncbi:cyclin-dependent kinase G-2-like isoform X2 [Impatiens glandulifera]|nr:cyclin-dependent kinase G-2-like isoform X2 [Impatiens glandulifera]